MTYPDPHLLAEWVRVVHQMRQHSTVKREEIAELMRLGLATDDAANPVLDEIFKDSDRLEVMR